MRGRQWRLRRAGAQLARNDRSKAHFATNDNALHRTTRVDDSDRKQDRPGHARLPPLNATKASDLQLASRASVRPRPSTDDRPPRLPQCRKIRHSRPTSIGPLPHAGVVQLARRASHASRSSTPQVIHGSCCREKTASGCSLFNPAPRPWRMTPSFRHCASCLRSEASGPWTS